MRTTLVKPARAVGIRAGRTVPSTGCSLSASTVSSPSMPTSSGPGIFACERLSSGRTGWQRESPSSVPDVTDREAKTARLSRYAGLRWSLATSSPRCSRGYLTMILFLSYGSWCVSRNPGALPTRPTISLLPLWQASAGGAVPPVGECARCKIRSGFRSSKISRAFSRSDRAKKLRKSNRAEKRCTNTVKVIRSSTMDHDEINPSYHC
jgi:hypothetical protein